MDVHQVLKLLEEGNLSPPALRRERSIEEIVEAQELWQSIQGVLANERERQLAYLLYNCGLKAADIMYIFPQEFSDPREISHVRRAVMQLIYNAFA